MTDNEKLDKRRYIKFTQKDGWLHKKCPECGVEFYTIPSFARIVCCSDKCRCLHNRIKNSGFEYDGIWFNKSGKDGYFCSSTSPRIVYHRYLYEKHYGKLPDGYIVHHIDHNKENNDITNLQAVKWGEHTTKHLTGQKFPGAAAHRERHSNGKFK